jgi:hypothetical protein
MTNTERATDETVAEPVVQHHHFDGRSLIERYGMPALNIALSVFLVVYLLTFVSDQRHRSECQGRVNAAIIDSLKARGQATVIADRAFDSLLAGLRESSPNVDQLIADTQAARAQAAAIRTDNPYPDPNC